ncbi:MAG: RluA family pseudouridine synthase [Clostridia bacterium]|nr:RluA family pseudouridine synthase [Clostridia bacterium]
MKKFVVKNIKKNNNTVIKYLTYAFKSLSNSTVYKALRNKDIRLNGTKINKDVDIKEGDTLEVYISDNILFKLPKVVQYEYEDDNIIVAYKPQGILSNNEQSSDDLNEIDIIEPTFEDLVIKDKGLNIINSIKICHRLDRNTAGLVIFSKNSDAHLELLEGFKQNYISKDYIAYVSNTKFAKNNEILKAYILKDSKTGISKVFNTEINGSKNIITEYTVLKKDLKLDIAKLNVKIHTGKTHQIRAHLSYIGHPIIGDSKYGINSINEKFGMYKQMLFAYKYTFNFPTNYKLNYLNKIIVSTSIPEYFDTIEWK